MKFSLKSSVVALTTASATVFASDTVLQINRVWGEAALNLADKKALEDADVIFVLSGGSGRIEHALNIAQRGQKVVVSGGEPGTTPGDVLRELERTENDIEIDINDLVILDRALSTMGNAQEIDEWLLLNPYIKNAVAITSDYHAGRAHQVFGQLGLDERVSLRYEFVHSGDNTEKWYEEAIKIGCYNIAMCKDALSGPDLRDRIFPGYDEQHVRF